MSDKSGSNPNKLLLVDDDPNLILLIRDFLEFNGYIVFTAENGREALRIVQEESIDMIICDIMMPKMDGYTFIKEMRQDPVHQWIPVMFLSAKGQSRDRVKGLNTGADLYMVKPFEPEELLAQINSSLRSLERLKEHGQKKTGDDLLRIQVPNSVELTPTEKKVVALVAQGMANREIAENLGVSQRTIESHVSNMLNKTGLHNRTELARWSMENNLF
jgi:DNA-binding NarL/FixJ family response regulator